jgi:hypothetical protein
MNRHPLEIGITIIIGLTIAYLLINGLAWLSTLIWNTLKGASL